MHLKRLLMALLTVPLLYCYVMYLPPKYFLFLMTFFSTAGLAEFYAMSGIRGLLMYWGLLWGTALPVVFFMAPESFSQAALIAVLTTMTLRLFLKRDAAGSISAAAAVVFGLFYIPGLLTFQLSLVQAGPVWIVMLYSAVWGADSAAFYVGRSIGKRKLYPEISPKKTVEGAVGSLLGGIIGVALIKATLLAQLTLAADGDHRTGRRIFHHDRRSCRVDVQT